MNKVYDRYPSMRVFDTNRSVIRQTHHSFDQISLYDPLLTQDMRIRTYQERLYKIEIGESDFDRMSHDLETFDMHFMQNDPDRYHRQRTREIWLRKNNPAVREAWDHYQLLLRLTDDGEIDE